MKKRPIPDNDIWIAAIALQHDLELYTNAIHFHEVEGLRLFDPLTSV
jgi:tRNA(fMet)-specific endonuclease VapC